VVVGLLQRAMVSALETGQTLLADWRKNPLISVETARKRAKCSWPCAATWLQRFAVGDVSLKDASRAGRPSQMSTRQHKVAMDSLRRDPHATMCSVTALVNKLRSGESAVSQDTVRRSTVKAPGSLFTYGDVRHCKVRANNVGQRRAATTQSRRRHVRRNIKHLVFMDAASASFKKGAPIRGQRHTQGWNAPGQEREPNLHGYKRWQFYAAVTLGPTGDVHRSPLFWVPAGKGLTSAVLQRRVLEPLQRWARGVFGAHQRPEWVMDNASVHNSGSTKAWMKRHDWFRFPLPAQSPDLNRIEKVWAHFKAELRQFRPQRVELFKARMQSVWQGLYPSLLAQFINELVDVMKVVHEKPDALVMR
jgi:transposase